MIARNIRPVSRKGELSFADNAPLTGGRPQIELDSLDRPAYLLGLTRKRCPADVDLLGVRVDLYRMLTLQIVDH
jgi:hypothetical protein